MNQVTVAAKKITLMASSQLIGVNCFLFRDTRFYVNFVDFAIH